MSLPQGFINETLPHGQYGSQLKTDSDGKVTDDTQADDEVTKDWS